MNKTFFRYFFFFFSKRKDKISLFAFLKIWYSVYGSRYVRHCSISFIVMAETL